MGKNFLEDAAHIVYASDNRYSELLGVSMASLFENSRDMTCITVYILDFGITEENQKKIETVCERYGRKPVWLQAKDISVELGMRVAVDRGSLSQYARLFVSSMLPDEITRVLYLDCDTLVVKSIRELWNSDLHGKTVGALMDAFSSWYRINIGLKTRDVMFNSGVMLIDLMKWKELRIEDRLLQFIAEKKGRVQQGDQGALNAVLSHETYCFEPRFNSVTIFYDFNYKELMIYRKPPEFYSEEAVGKAIAEPDIIHFTTSFLSKRAWVSGCRHMYTDKWLKYRDKTPWRDDALWDDERPEWKQGILRIYNILPREFAARLAGLAQAYGRPALYRFRYGIRKIMDHYYNR